MKTPEELNALKNEVETLNKKLAELTEEELTQVSGGVPGFVVKHNLPDCEANDLIPMEKHLGDNSEEDEKRPRTDKILR